MKGKKKYIKRKEKLAAEMAKREQKQQQDIRDKIMLEMAGTSGISMSKILSANGGDETAIARTHKTRHRQISMIYWNYQ